jgi:hypothetical protein
MDVTQLDGHKVCLLVLIKPENFPCKGNHKTVSNVLHCQSVSYVASMRTAPDTLTGVATVRWVTLLYTHMMVKVGMKSVKGRISSTKLNRPPKAPFQPPKVL